MKHSLLLHTLLNESFTIIFKTSVFVRVLFRAYLIAFEFQEIFLFFFFVFCLCRAAPVAFGGS